MRYTASLVWLRSRLILACRWWEKSHFWLIFLLFLCVFAISLNCECVSPNVSSATPGCAACAPVTDAPSACVRTSSTLSCYRWSGPNSPLLCSEGPNFFFFPTTSTLLPLRIVTIITPNYFRKRLPVKLWPYRAPLSSNILMYCTQEVFCNKHNLSYIFS